MGLPITAFPVALEQDETNENGLGSVGNHEPRRIGRTAFHTLHEFATPHTCSHTPQNNRQAVATLPAYPIGYFLHDSRHFIEWIPGIG